MSDEQYIWIVRWRDFQHYKPSRTRGPAWIKDYTAQLNDERYLELSDRPRALLSDLRRVFAATVGRVPNSTSALTRHRHSQTFRGDLIVLNHAGFIEFISRETLELRLDELYNGSRADKEEEKEKDSSAVTVAREEQHRGFKLPNLRGMR